MREQNNKTIIMISHQLSVAATCDRVLVMDKGEIVQEGNHKDLVNYNGLYKQLWEENWQLILLRTKSKFLNYDIEIKSMFEFLKTFMNIKKSTFTNDLDSVHRILKTDFTKKS